MSGKNPLGCPENKLVKLDLEPVERVSCLCSLLMQRERREMGERVAAGDSVTAIEGPGVGYILHRLSGGKRRGGGGRGERGRRILEVRGTKRGE